MTDEGRELGIMEKSGGLIIVQETEYEGHALIDIRYHYRDEGGSLKPTRKGIAIQKGQFPEFADLIADAAEKLGE